MKEKAKPRSNFFGTILGTIIGFIIISGCCWKLWSEKRDNGNLNYHARDELCSYIDILAKKYMEIVDRAEDAVAILSQIRETNSVTNPIQKLTEVKMDRKNLVIGMAQDIDAKNFVVFCASLRRVSTASVVIFMNQPLHDRHIEISKTFDIELIPFDLKEMDSSYQNYHPSTLRWILIYNYFFLRYAKVWLIDARDSVFQADPFAMIKDQGSAFYAFKGVETISIRECGWNSGWVKDCFGNQILNEVGNSAIICSGVSVGTIDTVLEYLEQMYLAVTGKMSGVGFPQCERNGVDQGVHNVLVHTGKIHHLKVWSQKQSPVLNLQARLAVVKEDGKVLNLAGDEVAVVHQYDRYESLQRLLFEKYVYWVDWKDSLAEWKTNEDCRRYDYVQEVDALKGKCDLKIVGGATGPSTCCSKCATDEKCGAFTFYGGQCFLKGKKCDFNVQGGTPLKGAFSGYLK